MFSANGSTDTNPSLAIYERASRVCNMSCLYSHTHASLLMAYFSISGLCVVISVMRPRLMINRLCASKTIFSGFMAQVRV